MGETASNVAVLLKTVVLPTLFSFVCAVGLIGNGTIIFVMAKRIRNKDIPDIYVSHLAMADFIFLTMLPFWTFDLVMDSAWVLGDGFCKITSGVTHIHMYASIFLLAAMAADQFKAVIFSKLCKRTKKEAVIICWVIWGIALVISIPPFYFRGAVATNSFNSTSNDTDITYSCVWTFPENNEAWSWTHHFVARFVCGFLVPLLVTTFCYTAIAIYLKTHKTTGRVINKIKRRVTISVFAITAVFILCWAPNQISNALYFFAHPTGMLAYFFHLFSVALAWGHSCVNPILWVITRKELKIKVVQLLADISKHCCCRNNFFNRYLSRANEELLQDRQTVKLNKIVKQPEEQLLP